MFDFTESIKNEIIDYSKYVLKTYIDREHLKNKKILEIFILESIFFRAKDEYLETGNFELSFETLNEIIAGHELIEKYFDKLCKKEVGLKGIDEETDALIFDIKTKEK